MKPIDWSYLNLERVVKRLPPGADADEEIDALRALVQEHFINIYDLFRYSAGESWRRQPGELVLMTRSEWLHLLDECQVANFFLYSSLLLQLVSPVFSNLTV